MTTSLHTCFGEVAQELMRQEAKFGIEIDDTVNTPWMWAAYISQYATKWMTGSFAPIGLEATNSFRICMIKVAALAIAAALSVDRQRTANGSTFYEKQTEIDTVTAERDRYKAALEQISKVDRFTMTTSEVRLIARQVLSKD